jgi:hypothetical protein
MALIPPFGIHNKYLECSMVSKLLGCFYLSYSTMFKLNMISVTYVLTSQIIRILYLRDPFPSQPILLCFLGFLMNRSRRVEHMGRIRRRGRRQCRVGSLKAGRAQAHVVDAQIRGNRCQIVGATRDVRRPLTSCITRWKVVRVDDVNQKETQDEPQNSRDRTIHCKQGIRDEQVRGNRQHPIQDFRNPECVLAQCHLYRGMRDSSEGVSVYLQTRHGVGLEYVRAEPTLPFGTAVPQTDFRHSRLLGEIEGYQIRKCANHCAGRRIDATEGPCFLHATGLLVVGGLWRNVVESQNSAVKEIHHYRPKVVLFVIDCDSEEWTRVQDSPDRPNYILEIGAWRTAFHKESVGDCVEAKHAIARAAGCGEAGGDRGRETLKGALVATCRGGPFQKAPDVIVDVKNRFA